MAKSEVTVALLVTFPGNYQAKRQAEMKDPLPCVLGRRRQVEAVKLFFFFFFGENVQRDAYKMNFHFRNGI